MWPNNTGSKHITARVFSPHIENYVCCLGKYNAVYIFDFFLAPEITMFGACVITAAYTSTQSYASAQTYNSDQIYTLYTDDSHKVFFITPRTTFTEIYFRGRFISSLFLFQIEWD